MHALGCFSSTPNLPALAGSGSVEQYVAEEKAESLKRGIKSTVKMCHKFGQSYEMAKASALEEYPDISESLIDEIIDEVYEFVK